MKPITVTSTGKQFATSTTAAATVLPFDSSGYYPKAIWVSATVPTYVKLTGPLSATAVAGDLLVQPADPVYLICQGYTGISAMTISGTGVLNVAPAEIGSWGDGTSLSLAFTSMTSLDSRITFTRADATSCATYFDSTGRLQTAAANVARFDYDPATVASYVAPILSVSNATAGVTTSGFYITGLSGTATVSSGKRYLITYTITSLLGQLSAAIDTANGTAQGINATGTFTDTITAATTGAVTVGLIARGSGVTSVTGSVSVQEVVYSQRGLLIEESRTNLLLQSRDMTNAAWSKVDVTPARTQVGIDGSANSACICTEGSAGTAYLVESGAAVTAGSTLTGSLILKRGNTDWIHVQVVESTGVDGANGWFNLNTGAKGTAGAAGAGTSVSSTITSLGGGWYRCTLTVVPNGTYTVGKLAVFSASADASNTRVSGATYIVDAAQLEVGSFATSYIPSAATNLTRAADSASMTGSNFSSWFNATQGTFVVEGAHRATNPNAFSFLIEGQNPPGTPATVSIGVGTSSSTFGVDVRQNAGGVSSNESISYSYSPTTPLKAAAIYDNAANGKISFNGATVAPGLTTASVTATSLQIGGRGSGNFWSGWVRRVTYYPTALTQAQANALTS